MKTISLTMFVIPLLLLTSLSITATASVELSPPLSAGPPDSLPIDAKSPDSKSVKRVTVPITMDKRILAAYGATADDVSFSDILPYQ
jgi:hypothetical protein